MDDNFKSASELHMYTHVVGALKKSDTDTIISSNEFLFNLFEADIIIRLKIPNKENNSKNNINIINDNINIDNNNNYNNINDNNYNNDQNIIINIEVDGISHLFERSNRFNMLRDKYVKSRGILVERICAYDMWRMNRSALKRWILSKVDKAKKENRQILPFGKKQHLNTLCVGFPHGVMVFLAGT